MEIYKNLWKSVKIYGNLLHSMDLGSLDLVSINSIRQNMAKIENVYAKIQNRKNRKNRKNKATNKK